MKAKTSRLIVVAASAIVGALALTIVGSSANLDGLLAAGIACWFAGTALLFVAFVAWAWTRMSKSA